jgi:glucuronate isomerase
LTDLHYYADIFKLISSRYYSKINFICSKEAEIHKYGSDSVKDIFSCSAMTPELSSLLTKHTVNTIPHLVPLNDLTAWRTMIQAMIRKNKSVRIYTKGVFESYDLEDVRRFEQIKRSYPLCSLVVGVIKEGIRPYKDREELVRSCKFVDEICKEVEITESEFFLKKYNLDLCL